MDFLRRLFGGGATTGTGTDPNGLYFYLQPRACKEVIRLRIDLRNDLSESDEGGLYVRKVGRGTDYKCMREVELEAYFNVNRKLLRVQVTGGTQMTEADYTAWVDSQTAEGTSA